MNNLEHHKVEYLLSQLDDNDFGVVVCLQHITGQDLLHQPRSPKARAIYAARERLSNMRPAHLLFPATVLQMAVFILAIINFEYFTPIFAAGNLSIVGLALIPIHIQKPKPMCHWV